MSVDNQHPSYAAMLVDWTLMRDCYAGERAVKAKGTTYLPATPGQILDGALKTVVTNNPGRVAYDNYKTRAVFPDYVREAVEFYTGMLHQKPPVIELPDAMKPMLARATNTGESMHALLRRINAEQIATGRLGIMLDLPTAADMAASIATPYIAVYSAESIINWDDSDNRVDMNALRFVVLDESGHTVQDDLSWKTKEQFRVLMMLPKGETDIVVTDGTTGGIYKQSVYDAKGASIDMSKFQAPTMRGTPLKELPFVFINSKDIVAAPDNPPLVGLARLCMTIYRGEADYRQSLFMQGQDTLITIGGIIDPESGAGSQSAGATTTDGVRVGAGARIDLNTGGDAKYIGVESAGLSEQRTAIENDRALAEGKTGQLISLATDKQESGNALNTRMTAQTASLDQVAKTGAAALEYLLKIAAKWMGQDPNLVKVSPNLDFLNKSLGSRELVDYMSARVMGAPFSLESIHELMAKRGMTRRTFEEEMQAIANEDWDALRIPGMAVVAPPKAKASA